MAALLAGGVSWANAKHGGKVDIRLVAVPQGKTGESGKASFEAGMFGGPLRYQLHVKNVENATMGHIHEVADNGTPGAILAWICPATGETPTLREGKFSGTLVKGEVTADRLDGPLRGRTTKELFEMLKSGKAGVAIHTKQNPGGELWGFRHIKAEHKSKSDHPMNPGPAGTGSPVGLLSRIPPQTRWNVTSPSRTLRVEASAE